jgi:hypothetical protein
MAPKTRICPHSDPSHTTCKYYFCQRKKGETLKIYIFRKCYTCIILIQAYLWKWRQSLSMGVSDAVGERGRTRIPHPCSPLGRQNMKTKSETCKHHFLHLLTMVAYIQRDVGQWIQRREMDGGDRHRGPRRVRRNQFYNVSSLKTKKKAYTTERNPGKHENGQLKDTKNKK